MIRLLRTPWLAALLLLTSPGVAGLVLPILHPCPVQDGPRTEAGGHQHGHSGHDSNGQQTCTCVGSCHTSVVAGAPADQAPVGQVRAHFAVAPNLSPGTGTRRAHLPLDLLPPITAPPLG